MKRTVKIAFTILALLFIHSGILSAQDKKNEQRIKVVTTNKSGTRVEIDTLITGDNSPDSIKLKDGSVIYLAKTDGTRIVKHTGGENESVFVTVVSDEKGDKGKKEMTKNITVISDDSIDIEHAGKEGNVIIVNSKKHAGEGEGGKVVSRSSSSGSSSGNSYIIVSDKKGTGKSVSKSYSFKVSDNDEDNNIEKTKYVIAKDGIVISVEGSDETKVKEMAKDIESKLGISKKDKKIK
jgi:hypothetical protein